MSVTSRASSQSAAAFKSPESVCSDTSSRSANHCVLTGPPAANSSVSRRSMRSFFESTTPPPTSARNAARRSSSSSSRIPCPGLRTRRKPAALSHFSIPGSSRITVRRLTPTLSPSAAAVSQTEGRSASLRISLRPLSVSKGNDDCCAICCTPFPVAFFPLYHSPAAKVHARAGDEASAILPTADSAKSAQHAAKRRDASAKIPKYPLATGQDAQNPGDWHR